MSELAQKVRRSGYVMLARSLMGMLAAMACLIGGVAFAGTTTASIQSIRLSSATNTVQVFPTGGTKNAPTCQSATGPAYLSFSMTRPMAKEYLAALLAAHARGTTVTLVGLGTCQDEATSETLDSITVN